MSLLLRQRAVAVVVVAVCLLPARLSADEVAGPPNELERILPALTADQRAQLLATGELSHALGEGDALTLVPTDAMAREMNAGLAAINSTVGMEVLFLVPEPCHRFSMAELATKLLEVSTLAGLQYHEESRDKVRTLIDDSYTIDNAVDLTRIPDTVVSGMPSRGIVHVYQHDSTFGWNSNTIGYSLDESWFHMMTTNDAAYRWLFVQIIPDRGLHSHLLLSRSEHYLVYYANFGARALHVSFFERRIQDSFYNRLVALHGWFTAKLDD